MFIPCHFNLFSHSCWLVVSQKEKRKKQKHIWPVTTYGQFCFLKNVNFSQTSTVSLCLWTINSITPAENGQNLIVIKDKEDKKGDGEKEKINN